MIDHHIKFHEDWNFHCGDICKQLYKQHCKQCYKQRSALKILENHTLNFFDTTGSMEGPWLSIYTMGFSCCVPRYDCCCYAKI